MINLLKKKARSSVRFRSTKHSSIAASDESRWRKGRQRSVKAPRRLYSLTSSESNEAHAPIACIDAGERMRLFGVLLYVVSQCALRATRSEERRVGKECRSRWA